MKVAELIELLKDLNPNKEIDIEGCGCMQIVDNAEFYEIEFWYESKPKPETK